MYVCKILEVRKYIFYFSIHLEFQKIEILVFQINFRVFKKFTVEILKRKFDRV